MATETAEFKCHDCRPCDKCKGDLEVEVLTPQPTGILFTVRAEMVECDRCEGSGRECGVWGAPMCAIIETCECECAGEFSWDDDDEDDEAEDEKEGDE